MPLFAQLANNAVTVTAAAKSVTQPDQVVFSVVVASGLDQSLNGWLLGISAVGTTVVDPWFAPAPRTLTVQYQLL